MRGSRAGRRPAPTHKTHPLNRNTLEKRAPPEAPGACGRIAPLGRARCGATMTRSGGVMDFRFVVASETGRTSRRALPGHRTADLADGARQLLAELLALAF